MNSINSIAEGLFNLRKGEDLYKEMQELDIKVSLQDYDKIKGFMKTNHLTPRQALERYSSGLAGNNTAINPKSRVQSINIGVVKKAEASDSFLQLVDKAEKQIGYVLSAKEFDELLKKFSVKERVNTPGDKLFTKISGYILKHKNISFANVKKASQGIQKYSEENDSEYKFKGTIQKEPKGYDLDVDTMKGLKYEDAEEMIGDTIELLDKQERVIAEIETDINEKVREYQEKLKSKAEKEFKKYQDIVAELTDKIKLLSEGKEANLRYKDIFIFVRDNVEIIKKYPDKMEFIQAKIKKLYPEFTKGYNEIVSSFEAARKEEKVITHPEEKNIFMRQKPKTFSQVVNKKYIQADILNSVVNFIKELGNKISTFVTGLLGIEPEVEELISIVDEIVGNDMATASIKVSGETNISKKAKIVKLDNGEWQVQSEEGKNLGSGYKSREAAEKRLSEVEMFKHMKNKKADLEITADIIKEADVTDWLVQFRDNLQKILDSQGVETAKEWVKRNWEHVKDKGLEWVSAIKDYLKMISPEDVSNELLSVTASLDKKATINLTEENFDELINNLADMADLDEDDNGATLIYFPKEEIEERGYSFDEIFALIKDGMWSDIVEAMGLNPKELYNEAQDTYYVERDDNKIKIILINDTSNTDGNEMDKAYESKIDKELDKGASLKKAESDEYYISEAERLIEEDDVIVHDLAGNYGQMVASLSNKDLKKSIKKKADDLDNLEFKKLIATILSGAEKYLDSVGIRPDERKQEYDDDLLEYAVENYAEITGEEMTEDKIWEIQDMISSGTWEKYVEASLSNKDLKKQAVKIPARDEFKIGDTIDTQDHSNMVSPVTIIKIEGNSLYFIDANGQTYQGIARATVRHLINEGAWKKIENEENKDTNIEPVIANAEQTSIEKKAVSGYPYDVNKCRNCVWFNVDVSLDGNSGYFSRCASCIWAFTEDETKELSAEDKKELKDRFQDRGTATNLTSIDSWEKKKASLNKKAFEPLTEEQQNEEATCKKCGKEIRRGELSGVDMCLECTKEWIEDFKRQNRKPRNKDYESPGTRHANLNKKATGEADQDYDHEFYDAIVNELAKAGFEGATHEEFDKYQGVELVIPNVDSFWVKEIFSTGIPQQEDSKKEYTKAVLIDEEGNPSFANSGDYFNVEDNFVFTGCTLILVKQNGERIEIEDPKKSDLPDITNVMDTFQYEKGTESEHYVLFPEGSEQDKETGEPLDIIDVTKSSDGKVDASELIAYCKSKTNPPKGVKLNKKADESKEELREVGDKIELEHAPTFRKVKEKIKGDGKLDMSLEEMADSIQKDHTTEFPKYYNKETGLPNMEKVLKKEESIALSNKDNIKTAKENSRLDREQETPLFTVTCPSCKELIDISRADVLMSPRIQCPKCKKVFFPTRFQPLSSRDTMIPDIEFAKYRKDTRQELDPLYDVMK